jgi:hypothetical protein
MVPSAAERYCITNLYSESVCCGSHDIAWRIVAAASLL